MSAICMMDSYGSTSVCSIDRLCPLMHDVTRKVGLVAQWYGARIVTQMDGGSSLGAGVTFFFKLIFFLSVFFVLFCFV